MIATHHWDDWSLDDLVAAKGDRLVSLVVPARNEAATVGDVVTRVREALVDTVSLLDEVVVIDSDSTDATYAVATDAGAVVHRSAEIRPDLGSYPGKGEAMWKSLFVTSGEVHRVHGRRPHRLGHPLRAGSARSAADRPRRSGLVKGFYERPGVDGGALDGGRVTELVARPLIALTCPELAGLVQPLAGEWAIRRSLFETLSVPTGYAVELAALLDTVAAHGTSAIAQVDLGRRAHDHQPLLDLGAMATQILAAVERRQGRAAGRGVPDPVRVARRRPALGRARGDHRRAATGGVGMTLRLGRHEFADDATLMMAIVNRTPDSFYDQGATWAEDKAFERVALVVGQGAEIVDIGGIKAAPGVEIDEAEEKARVVDFVARVREAYPALVISVDTWRAAVGDAACAAGADVHQRRLGRRGPRAGRRCRRTTAPRSSAPTPAGSRRAPAPTGSSTTTWSAPPSTTPSPTPSAPWRPASPRSRS